MESCGARRKRHLKRGGVGINEGSETAFNDGVQTLEETWAENPDIGKTRQRQRREKRRRSAGAKRRIKQVVRSSRPDGLRSFLGWLLPPPPACLSVSGARQSAASSSSRAPPKTKTRRRAERTGRRQPPRRWQPAIRQPASARRSGGPTGGSGQADAGSAGTRPACRASTGAAQRRPCQARRPAGRGVCSKARRRALRGGEERQRRAGGSKNRDASGGAVLAYVPSGATAPRGTRHCVRQPGLLYSGSSTAVRTRFRRHRQF